MEITLEDNNINTKHISVDIGLGYEQEIAGLFQFGGKRTKFNRCNHLCF